MPEYENNPFNSPMSTPTPPQRGPFRPIDPSPPQSPYPTDTLGMEGVPLPPNPQFDQGDGTYGPTNPADPYQEFPQVFPDAGPPVGGPAPLPLPPPVNRDNPFAENYDPPPQSHDRFNPNYVPPIIPPRAGSAGITPEQKRKMEEAAAFRPTGPPSAMQTPIR